MRRSKATSSHRRRSTEDELHTARTRRLADAPAEIRADCPDWCAPLLEDAFGDDWVAEAAGLSTRPPLDLRVNTLKAGPRPYPDRAFGFRGGADAARPNGIRIPPIDGSGRHPNVQAEPAFQKGWFEVQDEGSQVAAWLAGADARHAGARLLRRRRRQDAGAVGCDGESAARSSPTISRRRGSPRSSIACAAPTTATSRSCRSRRSSPRWKARWISC